MHYQSRFQALFEAAVEGMVVIDANATIMDVNPAVTTLFGYKADELIGKNVRIFMPEPHHRQHDHYIQRYRQGGEPSVLGKGREVEGRHKSGRLFPVYLSIGEFKSAELEGFVGIMRDLSASKATEDELLRTRAELESTLQYAPVAILTVDKSGKVQKSNRAAREMLQPRANDGQWSLVDKTAESERSQQQAILQSLWNGGASAAQALELSYQVGGRSLRCLGHYALVTSPAGEPLFIIVELADLTPLIQAEQEAATHRERLALAGRMEALGEMAASIAHELNQPLAAITLYAQTARRLLGAEASDQPITEILDKIAAQSLRAGEVIKQVRSLTSQTAAENEAQDVRTVLQEALRLGQVDARANGIALRVLLAQQPLLVAIQPIQLQQVVLNLLRNAIDALTHSPAVKEPCVELSCYPLDNQVVIEVKDNGPGVAEDWVVSLFEPFMTSKPEGMGIGLSLSQSIVQRHGGRLHYQPRPEGGAQFSIHLPLLKREVR